MIWRLISPPFLRRADWREDVSAYMDDELSPRERARIEVRLAESAEMREYLADLERMRSVLRRFEPAPSAAPFQLSPEMLNESAQVAVRASSNARALRLSMSTAAVGVATFAAVMVFDAIDSPTVNFTPTSATGQSVSVPTVTVVTDEPEVERSIQGAADSSAPAQPSGSEPAATAAEPESAQAEAVTVVAVASEQAQEAAVAEVAEQATAPQAAHEEPAQTEDAVEAATAADNDQAASDPSRRALTAGQASGSSEAQSVTAADVVAQEADAEVAESEAATEQSAVAEPESAAATTSADTDSSDARASTTAQTSQVSVDEPEDDQPAAVVETQSETRTVATAVSQSESDWPLEQRPRSVSVQLAADPSWERPVQIVLAAIAISATVFWVVLTIVDRRRRV